MSVELGALIRRAVPLGDVLAHAEALISGLSGSPVMTPLVVAGTPGPPSDVVIGPFAIVRPEDGDDEPRRYPKGYVNPWTYWDRDDLRIASQPIASIDLSVCHLISEGQRGLGPTHSTESERLENAELAGYQAHLNMGGFRTRPSLCLGALIACSIATLNRSRIIDDARLLKLPGNLIDPKAVIAMLEKHGDARTFTELADRFCADLGDYSHW